MTDQTRLTQDQKTRIADWLNKHTDNNAPKCPFCGSDVWVIGDHLIQLQVASLSGNLVLGGTAYPQVMLVSSPCGHTVFFNAVMLGLMPGAPRQEGEPQK
jgi:hypothetical protein